jgi:hypothetical protein
MSVVVGTSVVRSGVKSPCVAETMVDLCGAWAWQRERLPGITCGCRIRRHALRTWVDSGRGRLGQSVSEASAPLDRVPV